MAGEFVPFDPRAEFVVTQRNLPHWQQPKSTYFVTFRLADSLPVVVRERFAEMQQLNVAAAFEWMERYLDAGNGHCTLKDTQCREIVVEALKHFDGTRYALGGFVVMPNHVHTLVQPIGDATLASVMHSWKSYTAHAINRYCGTSGVLWQKESFDRIVRDQFELEKFDRYIAANPTTAGLAANKFHIGKGSAAWLET